MFFSRVRRWAMLVLVAIALVGCKRSPTPTPAPIATATPARASARSGGPAVASGEVVPAREVAVSFTTSGWVADMLVAKGDVVAIGDVLARLDTALLEADVAEVEAALAAAQAQLALAKVGPRPEEIAAAEAQLSVAEAALAQAEAERARPDLGATRAEVTALEAQISAALADRTMAEAIHDLTLTCVEVKLPGEDEKSEICPVLGPMEEQARYNWWATQGAQAAVESQLRALLAGASAEVGAAEAQVDAAEAQRDAAQARLELAKTGPRDEEIAVAEAAVAQAEAALAATRLALEQATVRAPCDGTVIALEASPGETVMPGQAVLRLASLDHLRVETIDLSEWDVAQVAVGQQARVYVEALGTEVGGQVTRIASRASMIGGDVVYTVVIELDERPPGLRWGMSVEVEIVAE
jgi:multidrug efflux pump subunit AcrA (membrane-fusion protein)